MSDQLFLFLQSITPQNALTVFSGWVSELTWPRWLVRWIIQRFIRKYGVNMNEAVITDLNAYRTFNDFFTRALKPACRPVVSSEKGIACPVDGFVSQVGRIQNGRILQAKGFDFTVEELLGADPSLTHTFQKGRFATLYLSPKDYHRVHMPTDGVLQQSIYIPGFLFSVNTVTTEKRPRLFSRNERLVSVFDTSHGKMAVVMIGAMLVASIETPWFGLIPRSSAIKRWDHAAEPISLVQGAEMGRFQLGSTVILLFENDALVWSPHAMPHVAVRFGQLLAKT